MVDRNTLLDQLKKYNDSQLEELIFRLEVDNTHLRTGGTRSQIAIDLIRYLEPQAYGLQRLQGVLRDLAFFREFTPAGTYLVGDELRQREEAREHEAMQAAAVHRAEPEDAQVTPEKFYSFQHGTEWLGVFREWDTPRSFRAELLATTICNSQNRRNCPAAAIIGHGGSGKSVALRRLALDLVTAGYKVWWVEEPERLVEFGLTAFMAMGDEIHFLLIDDIQDLDLSYVRRLQQHLQKHPSLVLVVAGRNLPANLRLGAKEKFIPDEMADRVAILDKITRILPAWADAASQLKAESLRQARLIRILVVLARRQDPIPKTLAELEEAFLQILVDDLQKIRDQFPGLATAIMDAAVILKLGAYNIARSSLLALADQHQPHAGIPTLFAQRDNNPRWELVESLLSYDPIYDGFQFHHDELAEGLIRASQERLAEPYIDDAYRKFILDVIVNQAIALKERVADDPGIAYTSSYVLNLFICQYPALVGEATALHYIRQLLAARIGHHAYLKLIVHSVLKLNRQERLALLLTAAQVSPDTNFLWSPVRRWVQGTYPREQQAEILQQLYQAGCRGTMILHGLLECLPLEQAKAQAREWIQTSQNPYVLCRCLEMLGDEVKADAHRLLQTSQDQAVLCRCLEMLGDEAKADARRLLQTSQDPRVLGRCLEVLGDEAKADARRLLQTSRDHQVLCRCLEMLGDEAKADARRLLQTSQNHQVLGRCLEVLGDAAKTFAQQQIARWTATNPQLLVHCFAIAGNSSEAKAVAEVILTRWQRGTNVQRQLLIVALKTPSDTDLRRDCAFRILNNWQKTYRPLVAAALTALSSDPDAVTQYCSQILQRWYQEIDYQQRNKLNPSIEHILKALTHPNLQKTVRKVAMQMLQMEASSPGFLPVLLYQQATEISHGYFIPWTKVDEETEQLPDAQTTKPKAFATPRLPVKLAIQQEPTPLEPWKEKLKELKAVLRNNCIPMS